MAYDEYFADRIRKYFSNGHIVFREQKMMGGLCFMVDDKMCVGTHIDKKSGKGLLMVRVGSERMDEALNQPGCIPMDFTGRPLKGFVFVREEALDTDQDISFWMGKAMEYNPIAQSSKRKKRKK